MAERLPLAVSGYRGIWDDTMTEEIAREYTRAFAALVKSRGGKKLFIGRDGRASGEILIKTIARELQSLGFHITVLGIVPTPTILFLVREKKYDGAIIITASHNPKEYNGLKFVTSRGLFTTEAEVAEINAHLEKETVSKIGEEGTIEYDECLDDLHIQKILDSIDVEKIKKAKLVVAHDPINSAGSKITRKLFQKLGVVAHTINGEITGEFAHIPEPLPQNLGGLGDAVREHTAQVGFAQDPDADRLVIVDEKGTVLSEEYTLVLGGYYILSKQKGPVVGNTMTSRMIEVIAKDAGVPYFQAKVGEANVVEEMIRQHAIVGGEGSSGGLIYPRINMARDSLTGIALVLSLLAEKNIPLSEIVASLPKFVSRKEKMPRTMDARDIYPKLKAIFTDATVTELDGVRFDFADSAWISFRPSNTEPIVRMIGEATTQARIDEIFERAKLAF